MNVWDGDPVLTPYACIQVFDVSLLNEWAVVSVDLVIYGMH